jgi:hypothetical protein
MADRVVIQQYLGAPGEASESLEDSARESGGLNLARQTTLSKTRADSARRAAKALQEAFSPALNRSPMDSSLSERLEENAFATMAKSKEGKKGHVSDFSRISGHLLTLQLRAKGLARERSFLDQQLINESPDSNAERHRYVILVITMPQIV